MGGVPYKTERHRSSSLNGKHEPAVNERSIACGDEDFAFRRHSPDFVRVGVLVNNYIPLSNVQKWPIVLPYSLELGTIAKQLELCIVKCLNGDTEMFPPNLSPTRLARRPPFV